MKNIVCFGEVLWDVLPTGKKLGGAPLNVALRAQSLGNKATLISSIGDDKIGKELSAEVEEHDASLEHIQTIPAAPTSEVLVSLSEKGSATYEIKMPCAWDFINLRKKDIKLVKESDAFIFGSLIARNSTSRNTLLSLLKKASFKVFDINLRPPHYTYDTLVDLMKAADFIKFNDDEIFEICAHLGMKEKNIDKCILFIAENTKTKQVCVTRGEHGAVLMYKNKIYICPGKKVDVADTVGAGDSFLAALINQLLEEKNPQNALDFACAVGAIVASKSGANPEVTLAEIYHLLKS